MAISFQSSRFGALEIPEQQVIEFPRGLVGIPGSSYALIDSGEHGIFRWLHSLSDPGLALPVADPYLLIAEFSLQIADADCEEIGFSEPSELHVLATISARPEPEVSTINLRAPLLIHGSRGYQVINQAPGAQLRAPLPAPEPAQSVASAS